MEKENSTIKWNVSEFEKHERSRGWYIGAISVAAVLFLLSIITPNFLFETPNFLFAVIVVISVFLYILNDDGHSTRVNISITDEGVVVGRKFYDYDEIRNFSIVYKPNLEIKNLYFEFNNSMKHRLSIPLENINPLPLRDFLLRYIPEDLERTDIPLSEKLAKFFKL